MDISVIKLAIPVTISQKYTKTYMPIIFNTFYIVFSHRAEKIPNLRSKIPMNFKYALAIKIVKMKPYAVSNVTKDDVYL